MTAYVALRHVRLHVLHGVCEVVLSCVCTVSSVSLLKKMDHSSPAPVTAHYTPHPCPSLNYILHRPHPLVTPHCKPHPQQPTHSGHNECKVLCWHGCLWLRWVITAQRRVSEPSHHCWMHNTTQFHAPMSSQCAWSKNRISAEYSVVLTCDWHAV